MNHAKYDELVRASEVGSGMNTEAEEAEFKFQVDHFTTPFHGCNADCVYKGFCYLNGICAEKEDLLEYQPRNAIHLPARLYRIKGSTSTQMAIFDEDT